MDLRKLKTLIDLVSDSSITELEITEADGKVRIVKGGAVSAAAPTAFAPSPAPAPASAAVQTAVVPAAAPVDAPPPGHTVKSPMVGTFYRSSSPGATAFVDVGSVVAAGEPVCIIEAMKIMNEIEADRAGTITQILAQDGQAVEFGQPLFIIE